MKIKLLVFTSLLFHLNSSAQTSAQLDINNINATVNSIYEPLFHQKTGTFPFITTKAGFEAPKGFGRTTIYGSNLYIGAMDENDSIHLAAGNWNFGGQRDFIPGPIMDSVHYTTQIPQWNRIWKIDRYDVLNHINNYNQPGYTIPQVFLDWPAHGNLSLGQDHFLAPYFDSNNNGVYEPTIGEYPLVPGDQCVYYIFNDDTVHSHSGGEKMKIEVHAFIYSFNCSSDSALQNTIFAKYKIINRSSKTYFNTSLGIFTDIDLGGSIDDYIGCNVQNGSYYGYNGDNFDDPASGALGYGASLISQSITFLGGAKKDEDFMDNPITNNIQNAIDSSGIVYEGLGMNFGNGIVDDERMGMSGFLYYFIGGGPQGDPSTKYDFYNYITGYWRDGTHMMYGGSGNSSSPGAISNGLIETTYMFPGESDPLLWGTKGTSVVTPIWNEMTSGNGAGDRRGIGWTGTFTFESGSTEELDIAYVFARDYIDTANNLSPVAIMNSRIDDVRNYFLDQITPCYTFNTYAGINDIANNISFDLFPNPSSSHFFIEYEGENKNLNYSIHDILGKEIISGKINSSRTKIDCENWTEGVYVIKMGDEDGYSTKKIIIE